MKKVCLVLIITLVATIGFGQSNSIPKIKRNVIQEKFGGLIDYPIPDGASVIVLVDSTSSKDNTLLTFNKELKRKFSVPSILTNQVDYSTISITLVDKGDFTVFPSKSMAIVPKANTVDDTLKMLFKAFFCIIASSDTGQTRENFITVRKAMQERGIPIARSVTYRQAVKEGWAPAPTNDIQRAVWDKVKADMAAEKK